MNNEMQPLKNETVPTSFLQKIVANLDKEMEVLEGVRLLRQEAERRIERIIAEA